MRRFGEKLRTFVANKPRTTQLFVVGVFASIGVASLVISRAAGPNMTFDLCENTLGEGNVFVGHDHANASCGHYVSFGFDPPTDVSTSLDRVATGASGATDIASTRIAGDNRLFIARQRGSIHISNNTGGDISNAVFLDISSRVISGGERGLLGLAFDPNYAQNGYFYVNYIANANRGTFNGQTIGAGDTVISRFTRSSGNPNTADPNSELIIMGYDQPEENHNGGGLQFGKDGFLYISSGDGGGDGDGHTQNCSFGNSQCLRTYLGKILRINVAGANASQRYTIPAGNPFVSTTGAKPEIWHYGLRNPWRFSFDRKNGDMFIGDVGQGLWEEVDYVAAGQSGKNFGWNCREGNHPFEGGQENANCANTSGFTPPIYEYDHDDGCSITGGVVYRGAAHPEFDGTYIFSDFCSSKLWYLTKNVNNTWSLNQTETGFPDESVTTFGEDTAGEVYVAITSGAVYKINVSH